MCFLENNLVGGILTEPEIILVYSGKSYGNVGISKIKVRSNGPDVIGHLC